MTAKPRRISKRWIQKSLDYLGHFSTRPIFPTQNVSVLEALSFYILNG